MVLQCIRSGKCVDPPKRRYDWMGDGLDAMFEMCKYWMELAIPS